MEYNDDSIRQGDILIINKLELLYNEMQQLRMIVDELVHNTQMWRSASKDSDSDKIQVIVNGVPVAPRGGITVKPEPYTVVTSQDRERLAKYVKLEKNSLSPFEAEVVKLTIAEHPLDFIATELNKHVKSVDNALKRALMKVTREDSIKASNDTMALFLSGNEWESNNGSVRKP